MSFLSQVFFIHILTSWAGPNGQLRSVGCAVRHELQQHSQPRIHLLLYYADVTPYLKKSRFCMCRPVLYVLVLFLTGRAVAAAMTSHWVCNVIVGQTFMGLVQQYGLSAVYAGFGAVALLGAVYISGKVSSRRTRR